MSASNALVHAESALAGKYRLIAELGHGGMAEVYLAVALGPAGFNKLVVIKMIRQQLAEDPDFLAMFLDEARLAARLSHPNVVQTNEVGGDGNHFYMAMEYLDGQPLNRIVARLAKTDNGMPRGMYLRVLTDVLSGLQHAHELCDYDGSPLEVVHRDINPHNVFVTYDGQVKIVDFGIAKALSSSLETRTGVLKGKVAYMAPEQMRGERVDRRADIFSMGVMIWEAATGRRMWKGMSDVTIIQKVVHGEIPTPSAVTRDVPADLEAICVRALAVQREARYSTAAELMGDLEAFLERSGERNTARDVGRLVATRFEDARARMRGIVEHQLRALAQLRTDEYRAAGIPTVADPLTVSGGQPNSDAPSEPSGPSGLSSGMRLSQHQSRPSQPSTLSAGSLASPTGGSGSSARGVAVAMVLALVTGGLLAAILYGFAGRPAPATASSGGAVASAATAPAPVTAAPTASVAEPPAEVALRVRATPGKARFFLDGAPLKGNPFSGKRPRDSAKHELRIEAEGYETETQALAFTSDVDLTVELTREQKASAAAANAKKPGAKPGPAAPPPPAPPAPPEDDMKPQPKPVRPLDSSNPYGQ